jgi:hypothetical protein
MLPSTLSFILAKQIFVALIFSQATQSPVNNKLVAINNEQKFFTHARKLAADASSTLRLIKHTLSINPPKVIILLMRDLLVQGLKLECL